MADADDIRERVQNNVEQAINERLGGESEPGPMLTPTEILDLGWDLSDYNSFFADCREDGYDASACGEMWTAAKDEGVVDSGEAIEAESVPEDILLVKEGQDASDIAATHLADAVMENRVDAATVSSDFGQDLLEAVDDPPPVPAHFIVSDGEVEVGDLEELFRTHLI